MKWVNITNGLPNHGKSALVENRAGQYYKMEFSGMVGNDWYERNLIRWLDEESNDPVFSLEDMRKSWEDGEFNGVYNFQQNLGSKDAATFKDFMKEQYKILIP